MSKKKSWWSYYSDHWWDDNHESEESSDIIDGGDKFSHCRYPHHSGYGSYYRSSLDWGRSHHHTQFGVVEQPQIQ